MNEFYRIYPTYKLNKIIYNTNDKIILDYEEKGKIILAPENNPLKVIISLDKSLNNEHAINNMKRELLLDNDNLEVTFNFIDSKFKV